MAGRVPESTRREWVVAMTAVLLVIGSVTGEDLKMEHREGHKGTCSPEESRLCTLLAEPLLRDPDLVFPDNMADIDRVCRTWRQLVGCVGSYTGRCFSEDRREAFQKGAGGALASVNALCTQSLYQKEYLGHAPCIKATLTLKDHCGMYYEQMVANTEVSPHPADKANMCCAHHMFRECVIRKAKKNCDLPEDETKRILETREQKWSKGIGRGSSITPATELRTASQFAEQVLDQALNFIVDQCRLYILNSKDCMGDRNGIENDVSKVNKTEEVSTPLPSTSLPSNAGSTTEHVTTSLEKEGRLWTLEREDKNNGNVAAEGKITDNNQERDEVVKVISGPKITDNMEKSGVRIRSKMGAGRSLAGQVVSEGTSGTAAWSSAAWDDDGTKHSESTTRVSSLGRKQISTTEPWYPSYYYGNSLDGANQQGLSSSMKICFSPKSLIPCLIFLLYSQF